MAQTSLIFIGIAGTVVALDRSTGQELWRTNLKGCDFTNVVFQKDISFPGYRTSPLSPSTPVRLRSHFPARSFPPTGNVWPCPATA